MDCPHCGRAIDDEAAFCPWCCSPIPGAPVYDDYDYEAFISYRHLPREHKLATRLQRSLEGFVVPKALREDAGKRRLGKLFRDEDELPTARSLSDQIREALKHARILIVICTPQTRESVWVLREVELFASFHGRERICVALCAGEPSESFPPLLLSRIVVDVDGTAREVDEEPIAADFRDGSRKEYRTELPRLAAALIGCGYDDLHQRMRARRQRIVLSLAGIIAAVSLSFGSFALWQRSQIEENYRLAQVNESELRAVQANELLAQGDRYQAISVALAGLPTDGDAAARPLVPAAQMALERAMQLYPQPMSSQWSPEFSVLGLRSAGSDQRATGVLAAFDVSGSIRVFDTTWGNNVATIAVDAPQTSPAAEGDIAYDAAPYLRVVNGTVVYVGFGYVACYDISTQEKLWSKELEACNPTSPLAVNGEDGVLALTLEEHDTATLHTLLIDANTGEVTKELTYERIAASPEVDLMYMEVPCAIFSPDKERLAVGINGCAYLIDLASEEVGAVKLAQDETVDLSFYDDGLLALSEQPLSFGGMNLQQELTVQRFGSSLDETWSFSQVEELAIIDESSVADTCAGFRFPLDQPEELREGAIVVLRNELCVFDPETGKIARRIKPNDSLLDCVALYDFFYLVTSAGDVTLLSLKNENVAIAIDEGGHALWKSTRNVGTASGASFAFGRSLSLVLWDDEPAKCRVYTFGAKGLLTNEEGLFGSFDLGNAEQAVTAEHAVYADGTIYLLNHAYLSADRTLEISDLPHLAGCDGPGLYRVAAQDLYVYGPDQTGEGSVVYAIPADADRDPTELVFDDMELDTMSTRALSEYATDDGAVLLLHDANHVRAVSMTTQEVQLDLSFTERLNGCWLTGYALVANVGRAGAESDATADLVARLYLNRVGGMAVGDGRTKLETYSYESGERVEAPWNGLSPWKGLDSCVGANNAGNRMAVCCADGVVRLYDTTERTLLWESEPFESGLQSVYVGKSGDNVLIQDGMGYLALLSGADGTVLKTSSLPIEDIDSYRIVGFQDDLIVGFYQLQNLEKSRGLVFISLDPDLFGPQSEVGQGLFCNSTGDLVAVETSGKLLICIRLTGSDLIDIGQEMARQHPLTNSERLLYGLAE